MPTETYGYKHPAEGGPSARDAGDLEGLRTLVRGCVKDAVPILGRASTTQFGTVVVAAEDWRELHKIVTGLYELVR